MSAFPRPSGSLSARIKGVEIILRERALEARRVAAEQDEPSYFAASLRGKSHGYTEAAELMMRLDEGRLLRARKWTRKDKIRRERGDR